MKIRLARCKMYRCMFAGMSCDDTWMKPERSVDPDAVLYLYRYCPPCAADELAARGFSVWHGNHQLPGIFRCYKCSGTLFETEQNPFATLPHMVEKSGNRRSGTLVAHLETTLRRYEELVYSLLDDFDEPVQYEQAIQMIECRVALRFPQFFSEDASQGVQDIWNSSKPYLDLFGDFTPQDILLALTRRRRDSRIFHALLLGLTDSSEEAWTLFRECIQERRRISAERDREFMEKARLRQQRRSASVQRATDRSKDQRSRQQHLS